MRGSANDTSSQRGLLHCVFATMWGERGDQLRQETQLELERMRGRAQTSGTSFQITLEKQYDGFTELTAQVALVHERVETLKLRYLHLINEDLRNATDGNGITNPGFDDKWHPRNPFAVADRKDSEEAKSRKNVLEQQKFRAERAFHRPSIQAGQNKAGAGAWGGGVGLGGGGLFPQAQPAGGGGGLFPQAQQGGGGGGLFPQAQPAGGGGGLFNNIPQQGGGGGLFGQAGQKKWG